MAFFSDNTEKGEEVAMDIESVGSVAAGRSSCQLWEKESLLPNERSNLGGNAESNTKLLCVHHKSLNHMLVKLEGKDVNGIVVDPALIREKLMEYTKHRADGGSEDSAKNEDLLQDRDREVEEYAKFAYLTLGLSYAVLYSLLSASLGRAGDKREVMMGVDIWSILLMMIFFISFYIPCPVGIFKIIRIIVAGFLFTSGLFVFVLLQLTL